MLKKVWFCWQYLTATKTHVILHQAAWTELSQDLLTRPSRLKASNVTHTHISVYIPKKRLAMIQTEFGISFFKASGAKPRGIRSNPEATSSPRITYTFQLPRLSARTSGVFVPVISPTGGEIGCLRFDVVVSSICCRVTRLQAHVTHGAHRGPTISLNRCKTISCICGEVWVLKLQKVLQPCGGLPAFCNHSPACSSAEY